MVTKPTWFEVKKVVRNTINISNTQDILKSTKISPSSQYQKISLENLLEEGKLITSYQITKLRELDIKEKKPNITYIAFSHIKDVLIYLSIL
jgi:hypothetical protein